MATVKKHTHWLYPADKKKLEKFVRKTKTNPTINIDCILSLEQTRFSSIPFVRINRAKSKIEEPGFSMTSLTFFYYKFRNERRKCATGTKKSPLEGNFSFLFLRQPWYGSTRVLSQPNRRYCLIYHDGLGENPRRTIPVPQALDISR